MSALAGRLTLGLCFAGLWAGGAGAVTRYVSMNGTNDIAHGYTNWVGAATNLQAAVDACADGDTVLVSNGTYSVATGAQVVNINKSITVRGVYGRAVTIIDGSAARHCVWMGVTGSTGDPICISGFTLQNGFYNTDTRGGGLLAEGMRDMVMTDCVISNNHNTRSGGSGGGFYKRNNESMLVVSNCVIVHNQATNGGSGGAGYVERGSVRLFNCEIARNTAGGGGGFYLLSTAHLLELQSCRVSSNVASSSAGGGINSQVKAEDSANGCIVINNCTFSENSATNSSGGAVYIRGWTLFETAYISNCVIRGNISSGFGGGIAFTGSGRLTGCLIAGNRTSGSIGGGLYIAASFPVACANLTIVSNRADVNNGGGFYAPTASTGSVVNSIIYGNTTGPGSDAWSSNLFVGSSSVSFTNCCTAPLTQVVGYGNISNAPQFVSMAGGDYRLAAGSSCINTGTNQGWMALATDLDGRSRLDYFSRCVDMGAYEYVPVGAMFLVR